MRRRCAMDALQHGAVGACSLPEVGDGVISDGDDVSEVWIHVPRHAARTKDQLGVMTII